MAQTIKSMAKQLSKKYPNKHITIAKKIGYYASSPNKLKDGYEYYVENLESNSYEYITYKQLSSFVKNLLK